MIPSSAGAHACVAVPRRGTHGRGRRCHSDLCATKLHVKYLPGSLHAAGPANSDPVNRARASPLPIAPRHFPLSSRTPPPYDVLVVGGSYAGLAAALTLGRSLRRVAVVDSGRPANRFAPAAHNVLTHDGRPPGEIARLARQQVAAYPSVALVDAVAREASRREGRFVVELDTGATLAADALLFATGMRDVLPELPGLRAC